MAENRVTRMGERQRWTSKKKAEAALEITKGNQGKSKLDLDD